MRHPEELFLMCRMAWWISVVSILAQLWSLPRALELVSGGKAERSSSKRADRERQLAQTIDQLLSVDILFFRPKCWKRAAVLRRYLLKCGRATTIVFGVRRDADGKLDGHAWLEYEGLPILETTSPDYVVTYRFPSQEKVAA